MESVVLTVVILLSSFLIATGAILGCWGHGIKFPVCCSGWGKVYNLIVLSHGISFDNS